MFCKYCGTQIPDGSAVCSSCGKQLTSAPAPAAPPVSSPNPMYQPASGSSAAISGLPIAKIIRITLIAAILVFFLPFMTVSCDGSRKVSETCSGFALATTIGGGKDELLSQTAQNAKANIFIAGALGCAIAAAVLVFTANKHKTASLLSAVGAGLLVFARITFRSYYGLNGEYSEVIHVEMRFGMILAIILFLFNFLVCRSQQSEQQTPAASSFRLPPTR